MPSQFCITVRFLQPCAHGRGDGEEPEWPPSPLRVFQALVAAAAARWNERTRLEYAVPALEWLAKQPAPTVIASQGVPSGVKYRLYVPDNVADKVAKAWSGGNTSASIADSRTEKDVRPTHLIGKSDELPAVNYLYPIGDTDSEFATHKETLVTAARSVTHLGWGVDMVAGDARVLSEEEAANLTGEHWRPAAGASTTQLRAPRAGTLNALAQKHEAFLNRLSADGFKPVPPLTVFDTVGYRRDTEPAAREWVAFRITSVDPDAPNPSFDAPAKCRDVAAWVRHATGEVCRNWPFSDFASFVHGHTESGLQTKGERADERFMYLPLPSIERRGDRREHVGAIRRVLVAAPPGFGERIEWIRRRLPGQELVWDNRAQGLLNALPDSDWVLRRYTENAQTWSTVTPVIWPGHDDHDPEKAARLLRKAFVDAGFARAVVDAITELDWRPVGFRAGAELASRYALPDRLNGRRYHVRVRFAHPVRGPLAVGAGRYRGLGVFAAE
ncbi:CRISPR-associated protein, family (Cas_GSU0054) [Gemmata obscuriglobus]|uniref:Type I-U CRISPR-associated protein Cas5/Cas6 n=1 Tax=Gemmata obscuriglobus TaxID=114 RepID=A0A2Z3GP49_9BACT|nr:type I-U CRISPR-associated protein Cas5/Cas6 [Gemmata obscuriglobus]QEG31918.1 CRISPR-associated protein, family (Cas_GSU0054) [Gemmata obscuriglobus]VTS11264.1 CRISPR-associated protein, GSU0054 family OS=Planctomyces limnophilus (strain ATCC 43296 / DSM 3776 / IFAM 1008 / 290) GN=Plim_3150 PE=4 SV=1: Cas_GSU0054 [Gemmata obscuriglobus UQM 2246]